MTVLSNNSRLLGLSRYGVMKGPRFACGISLAPEGMFKGYSIVVSTFPIQLSWNEAYHANQLVLVAKALLHPRLSKEGREIVLGGLLQQLDAEEGQNLGLACALYVNFVALKEEGAVLEFILSPMAQQIVEKALQESQSQASEAA